MTTFFMRRRQALLARGTLPEGVTNQGHDAVAPELSSPGLSLGEKIAALAALSFAFGTSLTVAIQSNGRHGLGLAILIALFMVMLGRDIKRRLKWVPVDGHASRSTPHIVR
ncbi:hypothetical protein G3A43_08355 [Paraburkholderia aspalathi]|nr:hypothetical protein [Paraburkholderia aspalathi]MBK3780268.1 hypothetical protein [Paraburkholderia aspalathi]